MTATMLDAARVANYWQLLKQLCPRASGFAIRDTRGNWISTGSAVKQEANAAFRNASSKQQLEKQGMDRLDLEDGGALYVMTLTLPNDAKAGTLFVRIAPAEDTSQVASEAEVYRELVPFLACLANELRLNSELDEIATELTVRYEELNLVYHTEDQVSLFDESQNALKQLLSNCNDYLNVDIAVLLLPNKRLFVVSRSRDMADRSEAAEQRESPSIGGARIELDVIESQLKGELWEYVREHNDFVVINNELDAEQIGVSGLPYKLLMSPVSDHSGGVDGALIAINSESRTNFTNSDKNLLAVMARKVAKIVRSSYDDLTGLLNRTSFEHLVERSRKAIQRTGTAHCLLFLNIDRLSMINDSLGSHVGDSILKLITEQLKRTVRDSDFIARVGDDEFGLLILNCSVDKGVNLAENLRERLQSLNFRNDGKPVKITCRIGVSGVSRITKRAEDAIVAAHIASERARELGGNRVKAYAEDDNTLVQRAQQLSMVGELHAGMESESFELYGQLIAPLQRQDERHLEILLRMRTEDDRIIAPDQFLPAAERYQLMPDLDKWVVRRTCRMLAEFAAPAEMADAVFGVNLSGQSLSTDGFCEFVQTTLEDYRIPASMICFEITETAAVANMESALSFIDAMKQLGCSFALDDFGAGMSSFGYLKTFPVDYLKIDGKLVKDISDDRVAESMVAAIHQVGHVMGIRTIAEFVEHDATQEKLRALGVDFVQGYLIQRPRPLEDQLAEWRTQNVATVV